MPKVSVILPTYNRAHLLNRSVNSILNQTCKDFELIIVDDNSNDSTYDVIKNFADERIKYIKHELNCGASEARNTGMKAAGGKYIAFQDSDDEWLTNKLDLMLKVLEDKDDIDMVFSSVLQILTDGKKRRYPVGSNQIESRNVLSEILHNNIVATPAAIISRKCLTKVGFFDTEFKCFEDYDYFIRVAANGNVIYLPDPLLIQHETPGGVNTPRYDIRIEMSLKLIEKHSEVYSMNSSALAERYFRIGDFYSLDGKRTQGMQYIRKAINLNRHKLLYYIGIIISFISIRPFMYVYMRKIIDKVRNVIKNIMLQE